MDSVITSVRLPAALLADLHRIAGPRGVNHFIVEAIRGAVARYDRKARTLGAVKVEREEQK